MKILDSSVFILFLNEIEGLDYFKMLRDSGESLFIPSSVYTELKDSEIVSTIDMLITEKIIFEIDSIDEGYKEFLRHRHPSLGNGELNVLTVTHQLTKDNNSIQCGIDDKLARKIAKELGFNLTGAIGLLKILKDQKLLSSNELKNVVETITKSSFRIDTSILRKELLDE
ncbi:MAG TPA: hypothetical protein HA367_08475 [Candidatus Methanofastidiosum sp.]|nr:hypothetical protein [Methanofastidiosum sp.]